MRLSHIAASYVYQKDDGSGYVGRSLVGNGVLIGRRGDTFTDQDLEGLGLEDLEDHTDYESILAQAEATGAPITVLAEDGSVVSVGGPDESDIVEIPHPHAGAAGIPKNATLNKTIDPDAEEEETE